MLAVLGGDIGGAAADAAVGAYRDADRRFDDVVGRLASGGQLAGEQRFDASGGQWGGLGGHRDLLRGTTLSAGGPAGLSVTHQ
jgi:hypothetical protein